MKDLEGKRVYVIDDNIDHLLAATNILIYHGAVILCPPRTQYATPEAYTKDLFNRLPVDLILLDLILSHGVVGYDVYYLIRKNPLLQFVPVAVISSADPEIEIPKCKDLGINTFISKPLNLSTFGMQILDIFV